MSRKQSSEFKKIRGANKDRVLNVRPDPIDIRDRIYEPALIRIEPKFDNRDAKLILDQGNEGACTGFGLAATINLLSKKGGNSKFRASARMLYEMAKMHDEWPGEDYAGSSCRGAIRGWKNMGVCDDDLWKYSTRSPGTLTIERALAARTNTLGAYYRLMPEVTDYHAAINEVGAVYVSATVHEGWSNPKPKKTGELPEMDFSPKTIGGHAFAIVGYTNNGFIVQNSWGNNWGKSGFAVWTYEDWCENVSDGWVFRLALPTPRIYGLTPPTSNLAVEAEARRRAPKRLDIAGHFVHFDDGRYKERGNYWSKADDVAQTAERIGGAENSKYKHLLIYAHGGLNDPGASARRVHALKEGFKRNGIYPYHIMYDTGLVEELKDTVKRAFSLAEKRSSGIGAWLADKITEHTDTLIEDIVRKPVTPIWEEMKRDARLPFEITGNGDEGDGIHTIRVLAQALAGQNKSIHLAGHSTGGVLLGHLLSALDTLGVPGLIRSCSLMAPACSVDFYKEHYQPRLGGSVTGGKVVKLPKLVVYNLSKELEKKDHVSHAYRKSLLYLVSRSLERASNKPLLGMQLYSKKLPSRNGLAFNYSDGKNGITRSSSHGGFDNDIHTLNAIMKTILGKEPPKKFTKEEMEGY